MSRQIKLTDQVFWKLKIKAEQDGLTMAGEIQKLVDTTTLMEVTDRLERLVGKLENAEKRAAAIADQNYMRESISSEAKRLGY